MSFNIKNLITWTELAPSLQELFKFNQSQIFVERDNRIKRDELLEDDLNSLSFDREKYGIEIESLISLVATKSEDPRIAAILNRSATQDGQLIKLNTTDDVLFADDCYRNCCIVENDTELQQMKGTFTPIDLTSVFNSWYRFAHYCSAVRGQTNTTAENDFLGNGFYQNTGPCANYLNVWTHNMKANPKTITIVVDWSPTCGFVSPNDFYTNYYIRTRYSEDDDDFCFILVGFTKDSAGIEHTLSIVSCMNDGGTKISWAFIYDMDCPTQHIIKNFTHVVGTGGGHGTHYISAKRINSSFEFKKTPANSSVDNEAWTIRWSYPDTKPVDMPQAEYDNIGKMLTVENRVGVGVTNMPCTFAIADQYCIFEEQDIYALHTDDLWSYKEGTGWYVSGKIKNKIPDRTFMYNPLLKKLVYRKEEKSWTRIRTKD